MQTLRIFISSPGDVRQERVIAKKVISELNNTYRDYVSLETILWEDLPLEATASFQDGINYFLEQAPIDIAIFILWSRLGTALSTKFKRPDGSTYSSGTEYEFDMMYTLWKQTERPKIMVYVKDAEPEFNTVLSSSAMRELLDQKERLNQFIEEKFRDRETGTNYAYWQFQKQQTFEERLKTHLTRLIKEHIGYDVTVREWEGNPYVGLRSFEMSESSIFCGRKNLIYDISHKIFSQIDSGCLPTLLISGESGSGKSSFIKAGLLPHVIDGNTENMTFDVKIIKPSLFRGDLYQGLVDILLSHYPQLNDHPVGKDLRDGISQDYDFKYLNYAISTSKDDTRLVLYIDQFEELFTESAITEAERLKAIHLIKGISETQRILLVMSMRSDYYRDFASYEDLLAIKNETIWVDIPKMSITDWTEIVEEPARKANLQWEINDQGLSLKKQIVQEATELRNLPLLEFTLSKLYEECAQEGHITFEAYNKIGRLQGAIEQYAEAFYNQLSEEEQTAFNGILGSLLTLSNNSKHSFARKTPLLSEIAVTPLQNNVIQKAVDAHLLISDKNAKNEAIVTLSHENLITGWSRIRQWADANVEYLQKSLYYEKLAGYWKEHSCDKKDLLQSKSSLLEAEYFMFHHEHETSPLIREFLDKSLVRQRRKGLTRYILYFLGLIPLFFSTLYVTYLGTCGDSDIDEWIKGLTNFDVCSVFIPLIVLVIYHLYCKISGKYKYKTIKTTTITWGGVLAFVLFCGIYSIAQKGMNWFEICWMLLFIICAGNEALEIHRRVQWKHNKYKPYLFADRFETTKNIIVGVVAGLVVLMVLGIYTVIVTDKNEKYEKTLQITDELFDGLNNTSKNLSWSDQLYINTQRINYLKERWNDELYDTVPDKREGQLAMCYFNLKEPVKAKLYLYPDHYWDDHCLWTCATMQLGQYSKSEYALESLIENDKLFTLNANYITATRYVMIAEMLGRFDLAKEIYAMMQKENMGWGPDEYVNYGHILLMEGKKDAAYCYYDSAYTILNETNNHMYKEKQLSSWLNQCIGNDLNMFLWLGVGNSAYIKEALNQKHIPQRHFYTEVSDMTTTTAYMDQLEGTWVLPDSSISIKFFSAYPAIQYIFRDESKNEIGRTLSNYRIAEKDNNLYMEELSQDACFVSSEKIIQLTDGMLILQIIENGADEDKDKIRKYYKVSE